MDFRSDAEREVRTTLADYGFVRSHSGPDFIEFRNRKVLLGFWLDRGDELYATLGTIRPKRPFSSRQRYNFTDILDLIGHPDRGWFSGLMLPSSKAMTRGLARLVSTINEVAHPYLVGDRQAYAKLERFVAEKRAKWITDMELETMRQQLRDAWLAKDFGSVVETLLPHRKQLTASETAKLEYSQKCLLRD